MTRLAGSSKLLRAMNESAALAHLLDPGHAHPGRAAHADRAVQARRSPRRSRLADADLVVGGGPQQRPARPERGDVRGQPRRRLRGRHVGARVARRTVADRGAVRPPRRRPGPARVPVDFPQTDPQSAPSTVAALCAQAGVRPDRSGTSSSACPARTTPGTGTSSTSTCPASAAAAWSEIAAAVGVPVGVDNDVNLAAVAERRRGAGRDADGFALLWLGQEGLGLAIDMRRQADPRRPGRRRRDRLHAALLARLHRTARSTCRTWSAARAILELARERACRRHPAQDRCRSSGRPAPPATSSPAWPTGSRSAWPRSSPCSTPPWWCSPARSRRPAAPRCWPRSKRDAPGGAAGEHDRRHHHRGRRRPARRPRRRASPRSARPSSPRSETTN